MRRGTLANRVRGSEGRGRGIRGLTVVLCCFFGLTDVIVLASAGQYDSTRTFGPRAEGLPMR